MATCSTVMRNGVRCTSPVAAGSTASMCEHHERMARLMAMAPKKTTTPPTSATAFPLTSATTLVHPPPAASLAASGPLPVYVPTESFSDFLKVSFPGEVKAASLNCVLEVSPREALSGTLIVTNYRLRFEPAAHKHDRIYHPTIQEAITPGLPTACVSKLSYPQVATSFDKTASMPTQVVVHFRNCRTWTLRGNVQELMLTLNRLVFVDSIMSLFAFAKHNVASSDHGHHLYNLHQDFEDMGIHFCLPDCLFRITDLNRAYGLCPTSPPLLVVPARMTDAQVSAVAAFRSKARMPICCYVHSANTASLWRCAQPKRGVFNAQSSDDEHMLLLIGQTNRINQKVWIVDCRPELNARANNLTGGGTESSSIRHATVSFMNIANIHAMRESFEAMRQLFLYPSADADLHWHARVEDTKWLYHVRLVLSASIQSAQAIHETAQTVVVHCSDGWDRTGQICALTQMLLDPKYRTLEGFMHVIEKEWIKVGHKFDDRVGPGKPETDEQSPVFLQFLDCVWQLHRQYPTYFEFTGVALCCIAFHVTSGRFGTFLGNCDRERQAFATRTPSLWSFVLDHRAQFLNPFYRPYDRAAHDGEAGALLPPLSLVLRRVVLWDDMYCAVPPCGNVTRPPEMAPSSFHVAKTASEDLEMALAAARHVQK
ncbi:Aste57867_11009 [Aphanomyces stellatus]|uniref:Aste57867_11009 protein n=1 Tax=Aphanomyces stellatus TaxID=120398 RepID=A0A485KRS4_9STRA|nr:hypothetical protein As57867_010968 [Aphanomyces stellatus]VFT87877.1 Aste57867_11009 [Aphanomyces stellatus]